MCVSAYVAPFHLYRLCLAANGCRPIVLCRRAATLPTAGWSQPLAFGAECVTVGLFRTETRTSGFLLHSGGGVLTAEGRVGPGRAADFVLLWAVRPVRRGVPSWRPNECSTGGRSGAKESR